MTRTPTPFKASTLHAIDEEEGEATIYEANIAGASHVCTTQGIRSVCQANTDFIVRACNAHDDLLSALKAAEWGAETGVEEGGHEAACPVCPVCDGSKREGHHPACTVKRAIAKAEGR